MATRACGVVAPDVFVLARNKRNKKCWSAYMVRKLLRMGIPAYRVTSEHVPKYRPELVKMVINYGNSTLPVWWDRLPDDCLIFNHPSEVEKSASKIKMQHMFRECIPDHMLPYCTTKERAERWVKQGKTVVARTMISSHSGNGIVLSPPSPVPNARLYTELTRRRGLREYRVFIHDNAVIGVTQKRKSTRMPAGWWDNRIHQVIRAHKHGWVFCWNRYDVPPSDPVFTEIAQAVTPMLRWGCADVLVDTRTKEWYIVEINSAPGLSSKTTRLMFMDRFAEALASVGVEPIPNLKRVYKLTRREI